MIERGDDLWPQINAVANQAVRSCALGILTTDALAQQILREWKARRKGDELPSQGLLRRIALRICSRALCEAWRSPQHEVRNTAYENLRRYLERSLRSTGYAHRLQKDTHAVEDVLHQALEELYLSITRNPQAGPVDPASFLKWAQTIVIRQAHAYVQKRDRDSCLSIENQQELYNEIPSDEQHHNPQRQIERQELHQTLKDAILSHIRTCPQCDHGLVRLSEAIIANDTLNCEQCRSRFPDYYEATRLVYPLVEMSAKEMAQVAFHLSHCASCHEEYEELVLLSELEERNEMIDL